MKKIFLLLSCLIALFSNSIITLSQDDEDDGAIQKRHEYFMNPRMYPNDSIPSDAYINAITEKENLSSTAGYFLSSSNWYPLGPTPVSYYSNLYSGRIGFVKYDPRNTDIVYLGGANGGIWKSTDGGNNWVAKTDRLGSLSCGAIDIDSANGIIYFGSGDAVWSSNAYTGYGIFKSTGMPSKKWTKN